MLWHSLRNSNTLCNNTRHYFSNNNICRNGTNNISRNELPDCLGIGHNEYCKEKMSREGAWWFPDIHFTCTIEDRMSLILSYSIKKHFRKEITNKQLIIWGNYCKLGRKYSCLGAFFIKIFMTKIRVNGYVPEHFTYAHHAIIEYVITFLTKCFG